MEFKVGDVVKMSEYHFDGLKRAGCTEQSLVEEREMRFKVVEIPAQHGSANSIGISRLIDEKELEEDVICACSVREIELVD